MKKHFILALMAAFAAFSFCSCGDDEGDPTPNGGNTDNKNEASIVGEWSGIMDGDSICDDFVRVHFNFKADGTFEQIMPAWEEKDFGKYTVSGNVVTFKLTELSWLWPRDNGVTTGGYDNVYDQYGCYWNPSKYDENRTVYEDPFAQFAKGWPGRVDFSAKYSFDKNGNLHLESLTGEGAGFGLPLVYYKNPGFQPQPRL